MRPPDIRKLGVLAMNESFGEEASASKNATFRLRPRGDHGVFMIELEAGCRSDAAVSPTRVRRFT
jgi:hypothetical protein